MLYVPSYPQHLDNIYFEFVAKRFADAYKYDSVLNPSGLEWLEVILPFAVRHQNSSLKAFVNEREYYAVQPDDSFRAMCYFLPQDPLRKVAANAWQFDFDVVFFMNLARIEKTIAPQGMYHMRLMQEAIDCAENLVWGFDKELKTARVISTKDIFAEIEKIDEKYIAAPYAAFRLSYVISISAACVTQTFVNVETCYQ